MGNSRLRYLGIVALGIALPACDGDDVQGDSSAGAAGAGGSADDDRAGAGGASAGAGGASAGMSGSPPRACSGADIPREVRVRLVVPDGVSEPSPSSVLSSNLEAEFRIEGTVRAVTRTVEDCGTCTDAAPALAIELHESEGGRPWTLVAAPLDRVLDWEMLMTGFVDHEVRLMYRYRRLFQFGLSAGFTLEDELGVLVAAELGPSVAALDETDLRGFTVMPGADICSAGSGCDAVVHRRLVFAGDSNAVVGLAQDGTFTIDSRPYAVRNSGAARQASSCADVEVASPWSVWRQAGP